MYFEYSFYLFSIILMFLSFLFETKETRIEKWRRYVQFSARELRFEPFLFNFGFGYRCCSFRRPCRLQASTYTPSESLGGAERTEKCILNDIFFLSNNDWGPNSPDSWSKLWGAALGWQFLRYLHFETFSMHSANPWKMLPCPQFASRKGDGYTKFVQIENTKLHLAPNLDNIPTISWKKKPEYLLLQHINILPFLKIGTCNWFATETPICTNGKH